MENLFHFILYGLGHIAIATVLLILGLLFAPEAFTRGILRWFKPDLIQKKPFMERVRDAFEIMLGKKAVVPPSGSSTATQKRLAAIHTCVKEREVLQGNLFFLDLLKNYSRMLYFAVGHDGHPKEAALTILDQSLVYLRAYSQELKDSATFKTETADLGLATEALGRVVLDAQTFLRTTAEGERELMVIDTCLKQGVARFDSYMKERYDATSAALESKSQYLAELLAKHVEGEEV